eukprot:SAG31_NODE_513_length_14715_cov_22.844554_9_plen_66_part_00
MIFKCQELGLRVHREKSDLKDELVQYIKMQKKLDHQKVATVTERSQQDATDVEASVEKGHNAVAT